VFCRYIVALGPLVAGRYHLSCALLSLVSNIFLFNCGKYSVAFFFTSGTITWRPFLLLDLHDRFIPRLFAS
jgi:hypothetical protein